MTDDTTTARLDTTDPDRPRGDVRGLGDARLREFGAAMVDHWRTEAEIDCLDGAWVYACWCDCGWHGKPSDHGDHVAAALAPLVAGWIAEERAAVESSIREAILQDHVRESTDCGPDFCRTCSEAIQDWVPWPCAATTTARGDA